MSSTPADVLTDWLATRHADARVAIAIDADRLLSDSGILGRDKIVDKNGRQWQLVAFRGDDLAFRLRFRTASSLPPVLIVLTRGMAADGKIDVSYVTDILGKNETGRPLDLSLAPFFKRFCPQINLPVGELRRYKDLLLDRLEAVPRAAAKIIERWGRPDDWGRGQIAAMVILAGHPDLALTDLWPDETDPAPFLVHALRLTLGLPQLTQDRGALLEIIREAARPQVRDHLTWLEVAPEELAAFLVLRRFAANANLQNPSNQLLGLNIFSPGTPVNELETLAMPVEAGLRSEPKVWARVNALAETFLNPRRLDRVIALLPEDDRQIEALVKGILAQDTAPPILKHYLRSVLLRFFEEPAETSLSWVPQLRAHPSLAVPEDLLTTQANQCRGAISFLLLAHGIEARIAEALPEFPRAEALLDWYVGHAHHLLELEMTHALHHLEAFADEDVVSAGYEYLFGGTNDLSPSAASLKGRLRQRLGNLDRTLAQFVAADPLKFAHGHQSALTLLKRELLTEVKAATAGDSDGRVWVLVFDGMRYDTWDMTIKPILGEHFTINGGPLFCVLPSYTQIARTSIFAGCLPSEWIGYAGKSSKDEATLVARNLGLTQQEVKTKLRFITEADTLKARMSMGYADRDAKELNVLIFPISDECHDFRGDLAAFNNKIRADVLGDKSQGIRGILDDMLRRIRPEDTVLLTSDHGFTELLSSEAVSIPVAEAERAGRNPQDDIHYRFTKGFRPPTPGDVVQSAGITDIHFMAVGSHWFRREGVTNTPRYDHGGISLAEVVIPAIRLRRVTEKEARADMSGLNTSPLVVEEDKQAELTFAVENVGNVPVEFEFHAQSNLGEELAHVRSTLAPRATHPVKIQITGEYRETPSRELDLTGTVTAINLRLRHTDLNGHWREAIDGNVTITVKVKPKKTRLDTDALSGFDEV